MAKNEALIEKAAATQKEHDKEVDELEDEVFLLLQEKKKLSEIIVKLKQELEIHMEDDG